MSDNRESHPIAKPKSIITGMSPAEKIARFNELLAKLLSYNITILIEQIFENGIDPGVAGVVPPSKHPGPDSTAAAVAEAN